MPGAYTFAGSWVLLNGSRVRVNGSWVSGPGSHKTRHMKIRLDIGLGPRTRDPGPICKICKVRPMCKDPYTRTHMHGPICLDPYARTHISRPIFMDPYTQTRTNMSGVNRPIWVKGAEGGNKHYVFDMDSSKFRFLCCSNLFFYGKNKQNKQKNDRKK